MARLRLDLDQETFVALTERAIRERRPITWQAEVMLREALGLMFPYPAEVQQSANTILLAPTASQLEPKASERPEEGQLG
jgi:hypothetical protein